MGRRVLRRHIWGYSVCLCPIKGTPGLNEIKVLPTVNRKCQHMSRLMKKKIKKSNNNKKKKKKKKKKKNYVVSNRSDTNKAVQAQKMARGWKFWI